MTRYIILILTIILTASGAARGAEPSAAQVLANCAATLTRAPSVTVEFTVGGTSKSAHGTLVMAQQRYALATPDVQTWFNGLTQWTYLKSTGEVSITEPDADELMESNPFALLTHYAKAYTFRRVTAPKGHYKVELKPKNTMSGITKATITVNAANWQPTAIEVDFTGSQRLSTTITKITPGKNLPAAQFNYNPASNPKAEIIDLR